MSNDVLFDKRFTLTAPHLRLRHVTFQYGGLKGDEWVQPQLATRPLLLGHGLAALEFGAEDARQEVRHWGEGVSVGTVASSLRAAAGVRPEPLDRGALGSSSYRSSSPAVSSSSTWASASLVLVSASSPSVLKGLVDDLQFLLEDQRRVPLVAALRGGPICAPAAAGQTAAKTAAKRAGWMAVSWADSTVGWMADCWAERMAAMRVGSKVGQTAAKMAAKRAG